MPLKDPEKRKAYRKLDYRNNKAAYLLRAKKRRVVSPDKIKAYEQTRKEKHRLHEAEDNRKVREQVFIHYGNKCTCCGEGRRDFLTIDHINNDGAAHRKEIGITAGVKFYKWMRRNNWPIGFRILCRNCNWSAHLHNGTCTHKLEKEVLNSRLA